MKARKHIQDSKSWKQFKVDVRVEKVNVSYTTKLPNGRTITLEIFVKEKPSKFNP